MKIEARCVIQAPREKVFEVFSDLNNLPKNVTAITGIEVLTKGKIGEGTRFKETRVMFGKEASEIMQITEFIPPEKITEEASSNGMHYTSQWNFTETDGLTTVTIHFQGKAITLLAKIFSLVFFFMAGSMKKAFIADMQDLKNVIET